MKLRKNRPDYEASNVMVEADGIDKPRKIVLTNTHHGMSSTAEGDVTVRIRGQYKNSSGNPRRPATGTEVHANKIVLRAREIHLGKGRGRRGGDRAAAKDDVEITVLEERRSRR